MKVLTVKTLNLIFEMCPSFTLKNFFLSELHRGISSFTDKMTVNDGLERICKEAVSAYFEVL